MEDEHKKPKQPLVPFIPVPVRHRNDGWTVEKQYAFIEALAENARASLAGGKAAQRMSSRVCVAGFRDGEPPRFMVSTLST